MNTLRKSSTGNIFYTNTVLFLILLLVSVNGQTCKSKQNADLKQAKGSTKSAVERGVNSKDQKVPSPRQLLDAALMGNTDIVVDCIERGTDINSTSSEGMTALMYASEGFILEPSSSKSKKSDTLLKIRQRKETICSLLIKANCTIDLADTSGSTALHYAAIWGNLNICRMLIKNGASINTQDHNGNTALHHIVWKKRGETFTKEFVIAGADTTIKDKNGKTAFDYLPRNKK